MTNELTALSAPARTILVPSTVSAAAQAFLSAAADRLAAQAGAPSDINVSAEAALALLRPRAARFAGTTETVDLGNGALLYRVIPAKCTGRKAQVAYFNIHGGGFVAGGGEMCRILAELRAMEYGVPI
jgi:hypothetical protein